MYTSCSSLFFFKKKTNDGRSISRNVANINKLVQDKIKLFFQNILQHKMSVFERSVTCSFFQELYSHIDKNSGEKSEDMFLVKVANKGTSLRSSEIKIEKKLSDMEEPF